MTPLRRRMIEDMQVHNLSPTLKGPFSAMMAPCPCFSCCILIGLIVASGIRMTGPNDWAKSASR
jgi:hypothetical protein